MFQLFKIRIICANETEDISSRNRHWGVFQIKAVLERFCKSHKNTSAKESFLSMLQIKFQKKSSRILFTFSQSITGKFQQIFFVNNCSFKFQNKQKHSLILMKKEFGPSFLSIYLYFKNTHFSEIIVSPLMEKLWLVTTMDYCCFIRTACQKFPL